GPAPRTSSWTPSRSRSSTAPARATPSSARSAWPWRAATTSGRPCATRRRPVRWPAASSAPSNTASAPATWPTSSPDTPPSCDRSSPQVVRAAWGELRSLLEPGADRGDALGVEAEPVHPPRVPRVLDLEAAVHDHRQAALLGDPRALFVDHAVL